MVQCLQGVLLLRLREEWFLRSWTSGLFDTSTPNPTCPNLHCFPMKQKPSTVVCGQKKVLRKCTQWSGNKRDEMTFACPVFARGLLAILLIADALADDLADLSCAFPTEAKSWVICVFWRGNFPCSCLEDASVLDSFVRIRTGSHAVMNGN